MLYRYFWISLLPGVVAHSWLDCLDKNPDVARAKAPGADGAQGSCGGYPRYYPSRADPNIGLNHVNGGFTRQFHFGEDVELCPEQPGADYATAPGWRHMLSAAPGEQIFFGYTSNGHVAKDFFGVGTTVDIWYAPQGTIATVGDLSRSTLVASPPFPDGVCGEQIDSHGQATGLAGINVPCVQSFTVPDAPDGVYSFIWYWKDTTGSVYWSCFDVQIGGGQNPIVTPAPGPTDAPSPDSTAPCST